jgi:hypothetical protein
MSHQDIKRLAAIVALNPSDAAAATALTQAQARAGQESTRSRTLRLIADLNRAEALAPSHEAAVADDPSLVALRAAVTAAVKGAADVVAATAEDFGHAREWEADLSEEVTTALEVLDAAAATPAWPLSRPPSRPHPHHDVLGAIGHVD